MGKDGVLMWVASHMVIYNGIYVCSVRIMEVFIEMFPEIWNLMQMV